MAKLLLLQKLKVNLLKRRDIISEVKNITSEAVQIKYSLTFLIVWIGKHEYNLVDIINKIGEQISYAYFYNQITAIESKIGKRSPETAD